MADQEAPVYERREGSGVVQQWSTQGHVNVNCRVGQDLHKERRSELSAARSTRYPGQCIPNACEAFELVFSELPRRTAVTLATEPDVFTDWVNRCRPSDPVFMGVAATFAPASHGKGSVAVTIAGAVTINHRGPENVHAGQDVYWVAPTTMRAGGKNRQNAVVIRGTASDPVRAAVIGVAPGTDPTEALAKYEEDAARKREALFRDLLAAAAGADFNRQAAILLAETRAGWSSRFVGTAMKSASPGDALQLLLHR